MNFDDWQEKYTPVTNPHDPNASFDGKMFETFGKEFDQVVATNPKFVWTLVDDGESQAITNGISIVNRMGYFISEVAYDEKEPFTDVPLFDEDDFPEGDEEE